MPSRALKLLRAGAMSALLAPVALSGVVATASAADTPAPPSISPTTTAGDGPQAAPGQYSMTLPGDETERFLRVSRTKDEAVTLSTFSPNSAGEDDDSTLTVELRLEDGTSCDSDSASASAYGEPWMSTHLALDPLAPGVSTPSPECLSATEFFVVFSRRSAEAPLPVQVQLKVRPKATGDLGAAASGADVAVVSVPARSGAEVRGGDSPATATVLTPDTGTRLTLTPGKPTFYRVHVGWSQRLAASAQMPPNGVSFTPKATLSGAVQILSPSGEPADAQSSSTYLSTSPSSSNSPAVAATAPTRLGNLKSDQDKVRAAHSSGWYVIAVYVTTNSSDEDEDAQDQVPVNLTTRLVGQPSAGPTFVASSGQNLAAPAPGSISGQGHSDSGLSTTIKVSGSVLIVLLAMAGVGWALRRRA